MLDTIARRQEQIDANYEAFQELLPELLAAHEGKFVIMRNRKLVDSYYDTARDAIMHATRTYPDGMFSVQEITREVADLGWFSHAPHYAIV